jgi:hypothetical protein
MFGRNGRELTETVKSWFGEMKDRLLVLKREGGV